MTAEPGISFVSELRTVPSTARSYFGYPGARYRAAREIAVS